MANPDTKAVARAQEVLDTDIAFRRSSVSAEEVAVVPETTKISNHNTLDPSTTGTLSNRPTKGYNIKAAIKPANDMWSSLTSPLSKRDTNSHGMSSNKNHSNTALASSPAVTPQSTIRETPIAKAEQILSQGGDNHLSSNQQAGHDPPLGLPPSSDVPKTMAVKSAPTTSASETTSKAAIAHLMAAFELLRESSSSDVDPAAIQEETEAVEENVVKEISATLAVFLNRHKHDRTQGSSAPENTALALASTESAISDITDPDTPTSVDEVDKPTVSQSNSPAISQSDSAVKSSGPTFRLQDQFSKDTLAIPKVTHPAFVNGGWNAKAKSKGSSSSSTAASDDATTPLITDSPETTSSSVFEHSTGTVDKVQPVKAWWGGLKSKCDLHPDADHNNASCHAQKKSWPVRFAAGSCPKHPNATDHDEAGCHFLQRLNNLKLARSISSKHHRGIPTSDSKVSTSGSPELVQDINRNLIEQPVVAKPVSVEQLEKVDEHTEQVQLEDPKAISKDTSDGIRIAALAEMANKSAINFDVSAQSSKSPDSEGSATPKAAGTPSRLSSPDAVIITGYENSSRRSVNQSPHWMPPSGLSPLAQPFAPDSEQGQGSPEIQTSLGYSNRDLTSSPTLEGLSPYMSYGRDQTQTAYIPGAKPLPFMASTGLKSFHGRSSASMDSHDRSTSPFSGHTIPCASPPKSYASSAPHTMGEDPGPVYPFMFRSLQRRWPRSDKELIDFSRVWKGDVPTKKLGERRMSIAPDMPGANINALCIHKLIDQLTWTLAQEAYGSCHCQTAVSQRTRAMRHSASNISTDNAMPPAESINKENMTMKYGVPASNAGMAMSDYDGASHASSNFGHIHMQNLR